MEMKRIDRHLSFGRTHKNPSAAIVQMGNGGGNRGVNKMNYQKTDRESRGDFMKDKMDQSFTSSSRDTKGTDRTQV